MKEFFVTAGYLWLALVGLLLAGLGYILWYLPYQLWEKLRYEAQCLRNPPPSGGMYGEMLRRFKNTKSEEQK